MTLLLEKRRAAGVVTDEAESVALLLCDLLKSPMERGQ